MVKILNGPLKHLRIVMEAAKTKVAWLTQYSTNLAGLMAVIDVPAIARLVKGGHSIANGTSSVLRFKNTIKVFLSEAVSRFYPKLSLPSGVVCSPASTGTRWPTPFSVRSFLE